MHQVNTVKQNMDQQRKILEQIFKCLVGEIVKNSLEVTNIEV